MALFNRKTSQGTPSTVVSVAVAGRPDPLRSLPSREEWGFAAGAAVAGRIEAAGLTRRKEHRFSEVSEFWKWLNVVRHAREHTWVVCDQLTETLTMLGFWGLLDSGEFTLRQEITSTRRARSARDQVNTSPRFRPGLIISDDPPAAVVCWHRSGWGLTFVDWANYCDKGLEALATMLGREWSPPAAALHGPPDHWGDCLKTAGLVIDAFAQLVGWWRAADMGQWRLTIASGALSAMRHKMGPEIVFCPSSDEQKALERTGVFVGRCDAFWIGSSDDPTDGGRRPTAGPGSMYRPPPAGPYTLLDCSSFYGWLLSDVLLPTETLAIWREGMEGELADFPLGDDCMASVTIRHPTERFPYRGETGQYWPVGEYQTTLCGAELGRAIRTGAVAHVTWAIKYRLERWAAPWADFLWEESQKASQAGKPLIRAAVKSMLARVGGKFGQAGHAWAAKPAVIPPHAWARWVEISATTGEVLHWRAISWAAECKIPGEDPDHCWPAVFAFLTASGREWLLTLMKAAGPENVLYCATDSLLVTPPGLTRLQDGGFISPGEFGQLRVVDTADSVHILGPMAYRIGTRVVVSGRPVVGLEVSPGVWASPKRTTLRAILSRQGGDTIPRETVATTLGIRSAMGSIDPLGWVHPWVLGNREATATDPDPFRGLEFASSYAPSFPQ